MKRSVQMHLCFIAHCVWNLKQLAENNKTNNFQNLFDWLSRIFQKTISIRSCKRPTIMYKFIAIFLSRLSATQGFSNSSKCYVAKNANKFGRLSRTIPRTIAGICKGAITTWDSEFPGPEIKLHLDKTTFASRLFLSRGSKAIVLIGAS